MQQTAMQSTRLVFSRCASRHTSTRRLDSTPLHSQRRSLFSVISRVKDPSKGARFVRAGRMTVLMHQAKASRNGFAAVSLLLLGVSGVLLYAYKQHFRDVVPISNRTRTLNFPVELEVFFGKETYAEILKKNASAIYPSQHPHTARVRRIATAIVEANKDVVPFQGSWQYSVLHNDDMINAFVLPGGLVCVYTGMLRTANTDDELAVVLGHEIGHVVARHAAEQVTGVVVGQLLHFVLAPFSSSISLFDAFWTLSFRLPLSRKLECEADQIGLVLTAKAGFCPRAAPAFWHKMAQREGEQSLSILSTHPPSSERYKALHDALPSALQLYRIAKHGTGESWWARFLQRIFGDPCAYCYAAKKQ